MNSEQDGGAVSAGRGMREKAVLLKDIGALRREAELSRREAAKAIGLDDNTYTRAESGEGTSLASALKIARFMHMPVEEIWGLEKEK